MFAYNTREEESNLQCKSIHMNTLVDRGKKLPNSQLIWRIGRREKHCFYWTGQSDTNTRQNNTESQWKLNRVNGNPNILPRFLKNQ